MMGPAVARDPHRRTPAVPRRVRRRRSDGAQAAAAAAKATAVRSNGPVPEVLAAAWRAAARRRAGVQRRDGLTHRSDAAEVGLPPLLERRVGDGHRHLGALDVAQARALEDRTRPRAAALRRSAPRRGARGRPRPSAAQSGAIGSRRPARSHTVAPTQPPSRVTRAISASPATGSVMKWTTRQEPATSKESSSYGSDSAVPWRTSTPGKRVAARLHEGRRGVDRRDLVGAQALDEVPGQRAGAAPDVEARWPAGHLEPVGQVAARGRE